MEPITLTKDNFDSTISEGKCLVDFWASWCGPCKMLAPTIDAIAKKFEGRVTIGKVNVDDETELAGRYGVMSIPTLILFENGEIKEKMVGLQPQAAIEAKLR